MRQRPVGGYAMATFTLHQKGGAHLIPDCEEKIHRKKDHVLLTDRDLDLLEALHEHVVLSFVQIHERFFEKRNLATAMNRLRKIEDQGWIVRIRVPRMRTQGRIHATGVVFQLTNKGRQMLSISRPSVEVFEKCPVLNLNQLDHDLLIADIADHFKRQFPGCLWINGRYLSDREGLRKIPDAVLLRPSDKQFIAIEFELHGKSSIRYREIIANFKSSRRIEQVIYVTANTSVGRKIMSAIEGYTVPVGHNLKTNFFEFVRLKDCLETTAQRKENTS